MEALGHNLQVLDDHCSASDSQHGIEPLAGFLNENDMAPESRTGQQNVSAAEEAGSVGDLQTRGLVVSSATRVNNSDTVMSRSTEIQKGADEDQYKEALEDETLGDKTMVVEMKMELAEHIEESLPAVEKARQELAIAGMASDQIRGPLRILKLSHSKEPYELAIPEPSGIEKPMLGLGMGKQEIALTDMNNENSIHIKGQLAAEEGSYRAEVADTKTELGVVRKSVVPVGCSVKQSEQRQNNTTQLCQVNTLIPTEGAGQPISELISPHKIKQTISDAVEIFEDPGNFAIHHIIKDPPILAFSLKALAPLDFP